VASDSIDYELTADDDQSEFVRLRQRTWSAAAPYLATAVLAWVVAALTEYKLQQTYRPSELTSQPILRQSILQTLTQALVFIGLGLLVAGLLVAVLRQHERWRRDLELSMGDGPGVDDSVAQRHDRPVDVTPVQAWNQTPDAPDDRSR
jgi:hypothetical protein